MRDLFDASIRNDVDSKTTSDRRFDKIQNSYYEERFVWPLTSCTTIYSGVSFVGNAAITTTTCTHQNIDGGYDSADASITENVDFIIQWATQSHTCSLHLQPSIGDRQHETQPVLHSQYINRNDNQKRNTRMPNQRCVGYMATNTWEVFTFIDTSKIKVTYDSIPQKQTGAPQPSSNAPDDDNTSVTGTNHHHHRRNSSLSSMPESLMDSTDGIANLLDSVAVSSIYSNSNHNTPSISGPPPPPHHHHHHPSSSSGEFATANNIDANENSSRSHSVPNITIVDTNQIGQIRVRRNKRRTVCSHATDSEAVSDEYRTYLDFRPLVVHLSEVEDKINPVLMIWVGSADQNQLHCYTITKQSKQSILRNNEVKESSNGNEKDTLGPIRIDQHVEFVVLSPVMAMQHIQWTELNTTIRRHCLIMACQDGTVRLVVFEILYDSASENQVSFHNVQQNQVIIDGPIAAIHAKRHVTTQTSGPSIIHVTIGSMCGYVAELYMNSSTMEFLPKEGPMMVAQGFWNCRLHVEDSVMSVHRYKHYVCIGTQAGRCYIYRNLLALNIRNSAVDERLTMMEFSNKAVYHMDWSCQLPYPVHFIAMPSDQHLFVATSRSVHLFQQRFHLPRMNQESIVESANRIKDRIMQLQRQNETMKNESEGSTLHDAAITSQLQIPALDSISDLQSTNTIMEEEKVSHKVAASMVVSELVDLI